MTKGENGITGIALDLTPAISADIRAGTGTTNTLTLNGNSLSSIVNGRTATTTTVSGVSNTLSGTKVTTGVIGITGIALDLTPAISAVIGAGTGTTNTLTLNGNSLSS